MANPSRLHKGMEKGQWEAFHGGVKRGGAMTDGGETRKTAIPCSNGVPAVSTRCRGARRSDVCSIKGNGGAPVANFAGGAAVAMAARAELGAGRGREAARERKMRSAGRSGAAVA